MISKKIHVFYQKRNLYSFLAFKCLYDSVVFRDIISDLCFNANNLCKITIDLEGFLKILYDLFSNTYKIQIFCISVNSQIGIALAIH